MLCARFILVPAAYLAILVVAAHGAVADSCAGGQCEGRVKGEALLQSRQIAKQLEVEEEDEDEPAAVPAEQPDKAAAKKEGPAKKEGLLETGGERALLSRRVGCSGCVCHGENAAKCGTQWIQDAFRCGKELHKSCSWREGKKWGVPYTYYWCDNPFEVAKKCQVPRTCDWSDTFSHCLGEVANNLPLNAEQKKYMKMVTDAGCSSVDDCKNKVSNGLAPMWEKFAEKIEDGADKFLEATGMDKVIDKVESKVNDFVDKVKAKADEIAEKVNKFIDNLDLPGWPRYHLGDVCTPPDKGFWYFDPTDCGAFSDMGKIFTDLPRARTHFDRTKEHLLHCLGLKGFLNIPTPFLKIKWESWCLPKAVVTAFEFILGAFTNEGQNFLAAAINKVVENIEDAAKKIDVEDLVDNLKLLQMPNDPPASGGNGTSDPALAQRGRGCKSGETWSVALALRWGVILKSGKPGGFTAGLGPGYVLGCKDGVFQSHTVMWNFDAQRIYNIIGVPKAGVGFALRLALTFNWKAYPGFPIKNRVKVGLSAIVRPHIDFSVYAAKLKFDGQTEIPLLPDPKWPSSVQIGFGGALGSGFQQIGEEASAASEAARRMALARGSDPVMASIAGSAHALAGSDLSAAIVDGLPPRGELLELAKAQDQRNQGAFAAMELAQKRLAGVEEAKDEELSALQWSGGLTVRSKVGVSICLFGNVCR